MFFKKSPFLVLLTSLLLSLGSCDAPQKVGLTGYQKENPTDLKMEVWTPPEFKTYRGSTYDQEILSKLAEGKTDADYIQLVKGLLNIIPPFIFND